MPVISDLPTWISLSSSLLQARPTTVSFPESTMEQTADISEQTRITTRYSTIKPKADSKSRRTGTGAEDAADHKNIDADSNKKKARFMVKTHDTVSGSTLVFKTSKASDLGMVMRTLHGLGADMAGLPRSKEADTVKTAVEAEGEKYISPPANASASAAGGISGEEGGDGKASGSKKKKKGKKR
jgi:hypothetical protein